MIFGFRFKNIARTRRTSKAGLKRDPDKDRTGTHAAYFIRTLSQPDRVKRRNSQNRFTLSTNHEPKNSLVSNLTHTTKRVVETHTMIFELLIASIGLLLTTILMIAIILCMEQCRRRRETAVSRTLPINESNRQPLEPSQWVWSPFAPSAPHFSLCEEARVEPQPDVRRQTTLTSFTEHM